MSCEAVESPERVVQECPARVGSSIPTRATRALFWLLDYLVAALICMTGAMPAVLGVADMGP